MDPATAFAVASTAFSAIKTAFEHGREIESMIGDLGRWTSAVWDINRGARKEKARRKAFGMIHGIGLALALVGGFGMMARIGVEICHRHHQP